MSQFVPKMESDSRAVYSKMKNVISFNISGINLRSIHARGKELIEMEKIVEKRVKETIDNLKQQQTKFVDCDFGPTEEDEFGSISLYGTGQPDPAGQSKYPAPDTLEWKRPVYQSDALTPEGDNNEEGEDNEEV